MTAADDDDVIELDFSEADALFEDDEFEHDASTVDPRVARWIRDNRVMSIATLRRQPKVPWFIGGLVPSGNITVVHGHGSSRKSFIVLDWMLCAATHRKWFDHTVRPGRVLWIAGEGVWGTNSRIEAWALREGLDPDEIEDFEILPTAINLFRLSKNQAGIEIIKGFIELMEYDYVVVDTLRQASGGGEENSSTDIGIVYDTARKVAGSAKLIFIHHDPKNGKSKGARGSSAIEDDADVTIHVEGTAVDWRVSKLSPGKVRDAKPFKPVVINFDEVVVGTHNGEDVTSIHAASLGGVKGTKPAAVALGYDYLPADQQEAIVFMADQAFKNKTEIAKAMGGDRNKRFKALNALIEATLIYPAADGLRVRTPTTGD